MNREPVVMSEAKSVLESDQFHLSFMAPGKGNGHYYDQPPPPVCLLSVYLTSLHMTMANSPRPPLSVFAYHKQSKLDVGSRVIINFMCAQSTSNKLGMFVGFESA